MTDYEFACARANVLNAQEGDLKGYECAKCKNKGIIYFVKDNHIYARQCECNEMRGLQTLNQASGLDLDKSKHSFSNLTAQFEWQTEIFKKAQQYLAEQNETWWFIGGQVGCGKTTLCKAICRELLLKGVPVRYATWAEIYENIKSENTIDQYKDIQVLYLDDLLKFEPTPFERMKMFEIINYRYEKNLRTIISSEKTISNFYSYDEALASRISEKCKEYVINISRDGAKNLRKNNF